jgi:hypothetical protein
VSPTPNRPHCKSFWTRNFFSSAIVRPWFGFIGVQCSKFSSFTLFFRFHLIPVLRFWCLWKIPRKNKSGLNRHIYRHQTFLNHIDAHWKLWKSQRSVADVTSALRACAPNWTHPGQQRRPRLTPRYSIKLIAGPTEGSSHPRCPQWSLPCAKNGQHWKICGSSESLSFRAKSPRTLDLGYDDLSSSEAVALVSRMGFKRWTVTALCIRDRPNE